MKKFLRYIIHNRKKIAKNLAIVGIAIGAYVLAHNFATMERGYEAIGAEIFIPFLIIFAKDIWGMIKEPFKAVRND